MYSFFCVVGRDLKDEKYKYVDVRPTAPNVTIHGLKSNTPYLFSVMAANEAGGSKYLPDIKKTMAKGEFYVFHFIQIYICLSLEAFKIILIIHSCVCSFD